jgi:hypothetical protein
MERDAAPASATAYETGTDAGTMTATASVCLAGVERSQSVVSQQGIGAIMRSSLFDAQQCDPVMPAMSGTAGRSTARITRAATERLIRHS